MKREREESLRQHGDFAAVIREAKRQLREHVKAEARRAEVDGETEEAPLDVPVLAVEDANGFWTLSTLTTLYAGQQAPIRSRDRSERCALADLRMNLLDQMVEDRACKEPEARKRAARAKVWVSGRVPFNRIVSK